MNKLTAIYFSPTGGTKRVVVSLADNFKDYQPEYLDLTHPRQRAKEYSFSKDDFVIVGCPVYAGQLPQVQGLLHNLSGNNTPCVIVACYGNRHYENTLAQMQLLLANQGFCVIGGAAVVIPHIFSKILGANRPDAEDMAVLKDFSANISLKLAQKNFAPITVPGDAVPEIKKPIPVAKIFHEDNCTMCGTCIELCPVEAISADSMEQVDAECINCMRCAKYCPTNAREVPYGRITEWLESNFTAPRSIEVFK